MWLPPPAVALAFWGTHIDPGPYFHYSQQASASLRQTRSGYSSAIRAVGDTSNSKYLTRSLRRVAESAVKASVVCIPAGQLLPIDLRVWCVVLASCYFRSNLLPRPTDQSEGKFLS
ncbi:hypothetical protein P8C59_002673 [Phyllachora maydis]|uniref:Uncharacterized protein n=1 Tax=Phyllachora maydis TaxID=1825666 RepID=A0AAD9HYN3_9PEZI|nr:hypothetical protein P8C59_002673 [Phyllachora maydis]